jgi:hypothetical protein
MDPEAAHRAIRDLVRRGAPAADYMRWLPGYAGDDMARPDGLPFDRGYIGWSPGGDYMPGPGDDRGWQQGLEFATWQDARSLIADGDPDLNLVADFYFTVRHDTTPCVPCERSGLSPAARAERRAQGTRLEMDWYREASERMGEAIHCALCQGHGDTRTGPDRLVLNLWLLHPRKGASRGVVVREVKPEELEDVRFSLLASWERLSTIWHWVRS